MIERDDFSRTRRLAAVFGLAVLAAGAGLAARADDQPQKPIDLCLTNACSKPLATADFTRNEAAVAAALAAGHSGDLIRAGGTPAELAKLMRATCGQPGKARCDSIPKEGTERFSTFRDGSIGLAGRIDDGDPGDISGMRVVVMRDDGMAGIQAPPWIERTPELTGELANARPTTEPFTRPDGTTAHRVTGWRLQSGEVISQEEFGRRAAASRAASGAPPSAPAP